MQAIIQGRQDSTQNIAGTVEDKEIPHPLILSTIHSSKGLEYDTVYLLDVVDGVFPENMPKSLKAMDKKERAAYEEERRLFYVGVTRAKDHMSVFKLDQKSSFCEELVCKKDETADKTGKSRVQVKTKVKVMSSPLRSYASGGKAFSQEEYEKYAAGLGEGLIVQHKKLGEGVVVEIQEDKVVLQFPDGQKVFGLKTLYEYDLLVF